MWGAVCFRQQIVQLFLFFPPPFPPSLVDLVSIGLVSIFTDLVSVTVPGGWLPLTELPWMPVCPAQGLWLKAHCSLRNHCPLWQAPSPSSSIGDEFNWSVSLLLSTLKHLFESVKSAKSNYLSLHYIKIDIKYQNPPLKDSVLKMPLRKLSFSAYVISQNEALINKNNYYGTLLFMSKTSQSAKKSSSNLQKMKICPKSDICPFCNKAFN